MSAHDWRGYPAATPARCSCGLTRRAADPGPFEYRRPDADAPGWSPRELACLRGARPEPANPALEEALRLLARLADPETAPCSYFGRMPDRFRGGSCREFMTWQQGRPHPGCDACAAREFLGRVRGREGAPEAKGGGRE